MLPRYGVHAALLAALSLSLPASAAKPKGGCPPGKTEVHGACIQECPASAAFGSPDACGCPAGTGKILLGDGNGRCERLLCPTGASIPADSRCDCPIGYAKAPLGKGKVRCEVRKAEAK